MMGDRPDSPKRSMPTTGQPLMASLLARPLSRTVEETSGLSKRWYVLERGCMRAIAGWLAAVEMQEIKRSRRG